MKERIIQFLKSENKSSAQFAEEIGVQPSGISHILSGRNKPSLDFIIKMLEKYKFLSTEWLLFGKGPIYKEPEMQKLFDESLELTVGTNNKPVNIAPESGKTIEPLVPDANDNEYFKPLVDRIVWFYKDGSFKEYIPGH